MPTLKSVDVISGFPDGAMSGVPVEADVLPRRTNVSFGPKGDMPELPSHVCLFEMETIPNKMSPRPGPAEVLSSFGAGRVALFSKGLIVYFLSQCQLYISREGQFPNCWR